MVDQLFNAVKGLMVEDGELQTEDEPLKLAFKIVQEWLGVRRERGWPRVEFLTEDVGGRRAVSGRLFFVNASYWDDSVYGHSCAFFGVSSPESK